MCKALDCRKYALMFAEWPKEKQDARLANPQTRASLEGGFRKLAEAASAQ